MFDWLFPIPWRPIRPSTTIQAPEPTWPKVVDAEIRLRELDLREKELEVRRLEALAKLEAAKQEATTND